MRNINKLVVLYILIVPLVSFSDPIPIDETLSTPLLFDGVYQSKKYDDNWGDSYWEYLRFYEDGTVISAPSSGKPEEIQSWFNKQNTENFSIGTYTLSGRNIHFSTADSSGIVVDYKGHAMMKSIYLESYSHYNGNTSAETYNFVRDSRSIHTHIDFKALQHKWNNNIRTLKLQKKTPR